MTMAVLGRALAASMTTIGPFWVSTDPGYEVQIFSCMKCDAEITQSADRKGEPHPQAILIIAIAAN
jgi:hypothetical protein